mmetsp:Transcript_14564/g.25853  ORF Transcript_14564/g.25853 Transcript_14564/m.25853 type:complete len:246 (-) Transcript_14564:479-1216(-)
MMMAPWPGGVGVPKPSAGAVAAARSFSCRRIRRMRSSPSEISSFGSRCVSTITTSSGSSPASTISSALDPEVQRRQAQLKRSKGGWRCSLCASCFWLSRESSTISAVSPLNTCRSSSLMLQGEVSSSRLRAGRNAPRPGGPPPPPPPPPRRRCPPPPPPPPEEGGRGSRRRAWRPPPREKKSAPRTSTAAPPPSGTLAGARVCSVARWKTKSARGTAAKDAPFSASDTRASAGVASLITGAIALT